MFLTPYIELISRWVNVFDRIMKLDVKDGSFTDVAPSSNTTGQDSS